MKYKKSKYIRTIGKCYLNNCGFDLYENSDGTATIRFVTQTKDLPRKLWKKFSSLEEAENMIDKIAGENTVGVERVNKLKEIWL